MKVVLIGIGGFVATLVVIMLLHCWFVKDEQESYLSHLCVHTQLCAAEASVPAGSEVVR